MIPRIMSFFHEIIKDKFLPDEGMSTILDPSIIPPGG
jgi:hypothetical protein